MSNRRKLTLSDIRCVKTVTIGGINPNYPPTEKEQNEQLERLNDYLYNQGIIIGKDITVARYMIGEHDLTMQKTTYHIGFPDDSDNDGEPVLSSGSGTLPCPGRHSCNRFTESGCNKCPNVPGGCENCINMDKPDNCYGCDKVPDFGNPKEWDDLWAAKIRKQEG